MQQVNQFCTFKAFWFLTVLLSVSGCHRLDCPGYKNEYLNWIPYEKGDSLLFTDGTDTLKLRVNEAFRSVAYKELSWIIELPCDAEANASASGDPDSVSISVFSRHETDENVPVAYSYLISYNIGSASFEFQVVNNRVLIDYFNPADLPASFNNGFKEYPDVLKLEADTTYPWGKPLVYEMYIAKSVGLIQFRETGSQRTWSLMGK